MIPVEVTQTPWHFTTGLDLFDHWQTVIAGVFALVAGAAHANRGAHSRLRATRNESPAPVPQARGQTARPGGSGAEYPQNCVWALSFWG